MVLRLQKRFSPTAKTKKKGDLLKNTEFSQEKCDSELKVET